MGTYSQNMPIKKEKKILLTVLAAAFCVKFLLALHYSGDKIINLGDQSTFQYWAKLLTDGSLSDFYSNAKFFPYPPLFNYLLLILGKISLWFNQPLNGVLFNLLLRIPNILADLLTALIIFIVGRKEVGFKFAWAGFLGYLLQPSDIFITSVWGQQDAIPAFLLMFSLFLLIKDKQYFALPMATMSFLVKPQVFPFLLPFFLIAFRKKNLLKILFGLIISLAVFLLSFYPFYSSDPFLGPFSYYANSLRGFAPHFTASAFNFWYLIYGGWQDKLPEIFHISVKLLSEIIVASGILFFTILSHLKKSIKDRALMLGLAGFVFFLFFTQVKERYLFSSLPFFYLYAVLSKKRLLFLSVVVLSLLFSFNTIGFFTGWIWFGFWNSTFLSLYNIDKIIAALYILLFCYYLWLLTNEKHLKT